jgi:Tfp pilus assembly PilM family ATPase/Tfp pilus assembly protein PilN
MKLASETALGIDISESRISLALLKKGRKGIRLLRAASCAIPEGAIKSGNIEDPALLSRALKTLKNRKRIGAGSCAVSLLARPTLVQIMEISGEVPANIGQSVRNELRQCVALSGKKILSDFCGMGSAANAGSVRVLVTAAEDQKVVEIVTACNKARLRVEAIEPSLLAYVRAFHDKKIADKFDSNVLLAVLRSGELTICVFSKRSLDFVRAKPIEKEEIQPDTVCNKLAEEINSVIQYYEVEADDQKQWEVIVVADEAGQLPDNAEELLRATVTDCNLQVKTPKNALQDTPVSTGKSTMTHVSIVAVGLAMRLLAKKDASPRMNLLPAEAAEVTSLKKQALVTANIAAVLLLSMVLAVLGLRRLIDEASERVAQKQSTTSLQDARAMIREIGAADKQIRQLSGECGDLNKILGSRHDVDWPGLLEDIKHGTPKLLRITTLISRDGSDMSLQGLARSYEAVHQFVRMLKKSEHIESASVVETGKSDKGGQLIRYVINCSLMKEEGT